MPNAPTHDAITLITAVGADIAYFHFAPHPDFPLAALFTVAYIFAGYACAGDLDLDSKEYRRWGPFRFVWWPYQKFIRHRSRLSHGLFVGGIFRILYLLGVVLLFSWGSALLFSLYLKTVDPVEITRQNVLTLGLFVRTYPHEVAVASAGFILAGTAHSIADLISTRLKRTF